MKKVKMLFCCIMIMTAFTGNVNGDMQDDNPTDEDLEDTLEESGDDEDLDEDEPDEDDLEDAEELEDDDLDLDE